MSDLNTGTNRTILASGPPQITTVVGVLATHTLSTNLSVLVARIGSCCVRCVFNYRTSSSSSRLYSLSELYGYSVICHFSSMVIGVNLSFTIEGELYVGKFILE